MLSIQPLKSAKGAADYYAAAFEYYAGDAQALRWLGEGCARLGLTGVVEKEQLLALLEGKLPSGQRIQNKQGEHRPGFDMTFSAPKSVSILGGLGADKTLSLLHDKAVEKAIHLIEKEFAQARVVIDGQIYYVNTKSLVIAAFRQPSSRANDPDLHTHGVTMNITFTSEDGKSRALASDIHGHCGVIEQLQRHATYAGLLYRTELANLLKEQGYRLRDIGKGLFEIEGMPTVVLKEFSTRRNDIEAKMQEEGWEGARLASRATLLTRPPKEEHNMNILQTDWHQRAQQLGFDAHAFVKAHKAESLSPTRGIFASLKETLFERFYGKDDLTALCAKEAVFVAIETLSQQTSVFEMRQLKEIALKHTLTGQTIVPIEAVDAAIEESIKKQLLYQAVEPMSQQPVLTTPWALTLETETLSRLLSNQGILKPIATTHAVLQAQKAFEANSPFPLTSSQKNALMQALTSPDRFHAIQGYAGTGKTTLLRLSSEIASAKGFTLKGVAVTSSAVNELRHKAGLEAEVFPLIHQELLNASKFTLQKRVYILDEASLLSTTQGHELIKLIEQKGARLLLVGDEAQLSSVKCGRLFGQAQDYGLATSRMTDVIRQTNAKAKGAVVDAIHRDLYESLQKIDEVREFKTHEARIEAIAHHWLACSHFVREQTLVFAPTHANRHDITQLIRQGLKEEGTLIGKEWVIETLKHKALEEIQHHYTQSYQEGDVLRFNLQLPRSRIQAGDYLTVGAITEQHRKNKTVPLMNREGKSVTLHLKDLPAYKPTRAGFNRLIEVYETVPLFLCMNDKVLITRNNKEAGLVNSSLAVVKSINENDITLVFEGNQDEKTFSLNSSVLKHLDHGYVLTTMKVQGKDKPYALGLMESYQSFSATLRHYYVQISRAISRMTLVTDDKTHLLHALEMNDDTKKSALDAVTSQTLQHHVHQFEHHAKAMDVTNVVDKKGQFEATLSQKQGLIQCYRKAKASQKPAIASTLAWRIVTDATLQQLAKHQLGFSESTIRQDALKWATMLLLKGLNTEEQAKVFTVKRYLDACQATQQAWKSIHGGNHGVLQKAIAFDAAQRRNELASHIAERIEDYQLYLHHFSIGKLNRFGVSQYRIEQGEERAVTRLKNLSLHAEKHQLASQVAQFFKEVHFEGKEALAWHLKSQSKVIHPQLIRLSELSKRPLDGLWREINQGARQHEENRFRVTLDNTGKALFDTIKTYKSLNQELAIQFASQLYALETGKELPQAFEQVQRQTVKLRNEMAAVAHLNPSVDSILHFFKVDKEKIKQHAVSHHQRETVLQFKHSQSNFKLKKEAACLIGSDIKGHYPFIKELEVDAKQLNALMRIEARRILMEELSEAQKGDFLKIVDYKVTARQAACVWKGIFAAKEQGRVLSEVQVNQAQQLTAKRDSLASWLDKQTDLQFFLQHEKLDVSKIKTQAKQHQARLQTLYQLNRSKEKLLNQLEQRVPKMNLPESRHWHQAWRQFKQDLQRVSKKQSLYGYAMGEVRHSPLDFTETQKKLVSQYELERSYDAKPPQKSSHLSSSSDGKLYYDAIAITEALQSQPEETYRAIFGEPKKITSREMRYSSGLIVSLKGGKAGFWYDFSQGVGGNPLQALMRERGLSFQDALKEGAALTGLLTSSQRMRDINTLNSNQLAEEKNKILSAKSILKDGIPISGTLAETYLKKHRGIEEPARLNVLFWPKGARWQAINEEGMLYDKINQIPALLIAARNAKGEVTGVQRVYLDEKTGEKNTFMETAKLSKGKIEGSAGILQKGEKRGTLYLTEGPETGASLAMANPKATVLVSFGLSNLKNLASLIKNYYSNEIILAGDNDTKAKNNTLQMTLDAQAHLQRQGIEVQIVMPNNIVGRLKTDWNDVHQLKGLNEVKQQLGLIKENQVIREIAMQLNQEKSIQLEQYMQNFTQAKNQLSKTMMPIMSEVDDLKASNLNLNKENNLSHQPTEMKPIKQLEIDL